VLKKQIYTQHTFKVEELGPTRCCLLFTNRSCIQISMEASHHQINFFETFLFWKLSGYIQCLYEQECWIKRPKSLLEHGRKNLWGYMVLFVTKFGNFSTLSNKVS